MPKQDDEFGYVSRSFEQWESASKSQSAFDAPIKQDFKVYRIRDGKNHIRILPPRWENFNHYAFTVFIHYGVGPDRSSYLSLQKMLGKPDPIDEAWAEAKREGDNETQKKLAYTERRVMWIIDRLAEDEGPQLFLCPASLDQSIVNLCADPETKALLEIDRPRTGRDVRFYKEGKELLTRYDASKIRILEPSPLHDDPGQMAEWIDYVTDHPVPNCLQYYSYEHIAAAFGGNVKPKAVRDVESRPVPRHTPRPQPAAAALKPTMAEEVDDEIPDDPELPFEAEEPPPPPKKTSSVVEAIRARRAAAKAATDDED